MARILNVFLTINPHKAAKCSCGKTLVKGDKVVQVIREQGRFTSASCYHISCAEPAVNEAHEQAQQLMKNLITISSEIDTYKSKNLH